MLMDFETTTRSPSGRDLFAVQPFTHDDHNLLREFRLSVDCPAELWTILQEL
jgi:hypothetical protein